MRNQIRLALALMALAPAALAAQTPATARIEGRVIDALSGEPVAGVTVHVDDPRRHEVTHEDGEYHLLQLPPGRYTILFERAGYSTHAQEVVLAVGQAARVDVQLGVTPVQLEGVVVTATMGGRSADDALRPTTVVAGRDLQRQMDATIAGTLESEAGVSVATMGPAPARPVIRGLGGDRVLILEDGQRVGDVSAGSSDHAVAIDPISAERIEVVRGPAALFYGSNALGGVVNVITEEIPTTLPDRLMGSMTLQGRSASEGLAGEGSISVPIGRVNLSSGVSYRKANDFRTPLGDVENTSITSSDANIGGAWVNGWGHAGVSVRGFASEYGIPADPASGHDHGPTIDMDRLAARAQLHWTRATGPFDHIELDAKATTLDHREIEDEGEVATVIVLDTYAAELVGRHSGTGPFSRGAIGTRAQLGDYAAAREDAAPLDVNEMDAAIYALEELDAGRVQLQVGARLDHARRDPVDAPAAIGGVSVRAREFTNVAGSASILYRVREAASVGVALTRAFRTPTSDELYSEGSHLASYTFELGNPELEPETGHGIDLFLRLERASLKGEIATFWNRIDDYVYARNTGVVDSASALYVYRATNADADFRGAEAALEWSPLAHIVLDGSVSYVRADNLVSDEPLPFIPPLQTDVGLRYERTAWFGELGWRGAAAQERVPGRPELPPESVGYCDETGGAAGCQTVRGEFFETDGYSVWSLSGGVRWFTGGALNSITVSIENLGDEVYRNHLSRLKEALPEQGRSVNLIYRATF